MKKYQLWAGILAAGMFFTACTSEDDEFNPISNQTEPTDVVTFEGSYWDALIDNPQYMGTLLYGDGSYSWTDATTTLNSKLTNAFGDGMFWGGGIAISNYLDDNLSEARSFDIQLAVPVSNGSKNFAVVNGTASMEFANGKPRTIKSVDIMNTTYCLSIIKHGNAIAKALSKSGDYLNVIITGYNGETETGKVKVALAVGGGALNRWYTADLTTLGAVTKVGFSMQGSDTGAYGLNTPTYFAFDNVVVKK